MRIMKSLKTTVSLFFLLLNCLGGATALAAAQDDILVTLVDVDPRQATQLGNEDLLYVHVRYKSTVPLRFQAIAALEGAPLEVGASKNPAVLHAAGSGEALVWVGYANPTHVDAVMVVVLDEAWQELYRLSEGVDVAWSGVVPERPRQAAGWVEAMLKAERRKMDFVYDPAPRKYGNLYDLFFFLSLAAIPVYILLQLHMLWHYRYRWRELAVVPLFPYLILGFYALVGLEIETSLQVTFLFRYTPLALFYLLCLWCAKRYWEKKLPPPKLYKPPKA